LLTNWSLRKTRGASVAAQHGGVSSEDDYVIVVAVVLRQFLDPATDRASPRIILTTDLDDDGPGAPLGGFPFDVPLKFRETLNALDNE
ncbi:hypothetical protein, partial [Novosphingobium album (ex Hu et al. 2023)]